MVQTWAITEDVGPRVTVTPIQKYEFATFIYHATTSAIDAFVFDILNAHLFLSPFQVGASYHHMC